MANRLREVREARGLTRAALAEMIASGESTITKIELGERDLTVKMAERLASSLSCTAAEILLTKEELSALVSPFSGTKVLYWGAIQAGAPSNIMDAPPAGFKGGQRPASVVS